MRKKDSGPVRQEAKAVTNVLGETCILALAARDLRRRLAEPALAEFVEFVGKHELAADLDSMERMAESLDTDIERYFATRQNRNGCQEDAGV